MKKIFYSIFLNLLIASCLFSAESINPMDELRTAFPSGNRSFFQSMSIGGSYGDFAGLKFNITGSGFDLEDSTLTSNGHPLGTWTMNANFMPVELRIKAEDLSLSYTAGGITETASVPYILRFAYMYPEYASDGKSYNTISNAFYVGSVSLYATGYEDSRFELNPVDSADNTVHQEFRKENYTTAPQKLNIVDQEIMFILPEGIPVSDIPSGTYTANVVVELWSTV